MINPDGSSIELISVHMPKTAGSSFRDLLLRIYGEEGLVWDYHDTPLDPAVLYNTDRDAWLLKSREFIERLGAPKRAIHGHFPLRKYVGYLPNAKRITWVRHPVDRLLSHFFMWRTRDDLPDHTLYRQVRLSQMDLSEFAKIPMVRNVMTRVFLHNVPVSSLFFIGVQEHYRKDVKELKALMGWPAIRIDRTNVQRDPDYASFKQEVLNDRRLMALLTDLNSEDMSFYEAVLASRDDRRSGRSPWQRLTRILRTIAH